MERTDAMRQLIVQSFVTLDMVMQAPGGPEEDDSGGFAYGGWSVTYWDEQMGQVMNEATSRPFAMVLGRRTYDIMAAYWPTAPEEAGAKTFNDATKYVASRNRPTLEWSNSVLIEGDAAEGIRALKAAGLTYEIRTFAGAGHAFFNDTGERYNAAAAHQAYGEVLDWYGQHLS